MNVVFGSSAFKEAFELLFNQLSIRIVQYVNTHQALFYVGSDYSDSVNIRWRCVH